MQKAVIAHSVRIKNLFKVQSNVNTRCPVGCPSHPRALCNLKHFAEGNPDGKQRERTQREYNQEREGKTENFFKNKESRYHRQVSQISLKEKRPKFEEQQGGDDGKFSKGGPQEQSFESIVDAEEFWRTIYKDEGNGNPEAEWLNDVAQAMEGAVPEQEVGEIKHHMGSNN